MNVQPKTNFSRYSHGHLYQMLHQGDETTPRSAADSWDGVGARLHEQAGNLESRLVAFREEWQGGAAEQYQLMITDLSAGLRRIGDAMFAMRDIAHDAGDALVTAKTRMPAPVEVPDVSPATMYFATTPLEVDPLASTQDVAALRMRQSEAGAELARYQEAVAVSNSAHAQAVVVMNDLAVDYMVADEGIPVSPQAAGTREVPVEDEATSWQFTEDVEQSEEDAETGNGTPVFGTMFTAGVAAAAAATAGRLGMRVLPKVPDWAKKDKAEPEKDKPVEAGKGASGLGGGLGGKFGGGGGGGIAPAAPAAHPGMAGGPVAAQAGAALRAAAGAAGAGAMGMPFMPFMPFAPMGAGGANARRIPPWLTETEDVWGESSVITPPVLGEDSPARPAVDFPY
ncbi:WXG100 family type VII secretion target [Actinophytocola sp.]|uniref:WXG100 family type VII secretion target n=1 Tax=Actinophytocola sp. TaxID=1872138 RepID=UPI002ED158AE